jgi:hypothetical protein
MTDLPILYGLADDLARKDHNFNKTKGPSVGDRATRRYMDKLNKAARRHLRNRVHIEEAVMEGTGLNFDFYLPWERTAVEVALGLHNSASEWEKDLFKALLAKHHGKPIRKLVFLTRRKGLSVRSSPSARAEIAFMKSQGIEVALLPLRARQLPLRRA